MAAVYSSGAWTAASLFPEASVSIFSLKTNKVICENLGCRDSEPVAKEIYDTIQDVNDFFRTTFGVKGLNQGNPVKVGIAWDEDNAACSCTSSLGDREVSCSFLFNNKRIDRMTVAHEWTHALISHLAPLNKSGQAGSLDESLADCFAVFFEWKTSRYLNLKIADRDLTVHPQRFHRARDVHENSTIPSHAFYVTLTQVSKEQVDLIGFIWFRAMLRMRRNETFASFAQKTIDVARTLTRSPQVNAKLARAIQLSWAHVENEMP
jgi:Zn-dependent metalloprotease